MIDHTDSQLLSAYAETRLEAAFAELVRRDRQWFISPVGFSSAPYKLPDDQQAGAR